MSAAWTVAARELRARRMVLTAIPIVAALPFVARLTGSHGLDVSGMLALLLCAPFPFAVAIGVGASMFSRELGERRLGFYFARPISAGALFAGKLVAALAVVLVAFAVTQVPVMQALPPAFLGPRAAYGRVAAFVLGALALLVAAANAAASMYRARSRWFLLDVLLGAACVAAFGSIVRTTVVAGAFLSVHGRLPIVMGAATIVLLIAGAAQVAIGRTDPRRAHRVLSAATWIGLAIVLAGFAAWQRWLLGGTPRETGGIGYPLVASPAGDGVFFRGLAGRAGFRPFFLIDARTGSFLRLSPDGRPLPTFSADGSAAAWLSVPEPWEGAEAGDYRPRVSVVRMDGGPRLVTRVPMERREARWHSVLAVANGGRQAVIAGDRAVGLVDLDTARVAASIDRAHVTAADLLPDGRIRLFQAVPDAGGATLVVAAWSPRDGSLAEIVRLAGATLVTRGPGLAVAATGMREKAIVDLATGAVRRFEGAANDTVPRALVLSDGRVAAGMGAEVRILDAGGSTVLAVPVPPQAQVSALREPAPGQLAIGLWSPLLSQKGTLFVDVASGSVLREEKGLQPAGPQAGGPWPQPAAGSTASRLFTDEEGALVALDDAGRRRVVVPAAPEAGRR